MASRYIVIKNNTRCFQSALQQSLDVSFLVLRLISPAAMFSQCSRVSHHNCMGMTKRAPLLQKKITTLFSNLFLQIKCIQQSAVLDVVDPLTQSTQLGIDLYIQPYTQLSGPCQRVNNIQHIALYCFECLLSKEVSSTTTLLSSEVEGPYGSYPYNCGGRHACSG